MSYTSFTRPTRTATASRVQDDDDDSVPRCRCPSKRRAVRRRAGPMTKNPNRYFFTCPLSRDDKDNCKFFQWADEVEGSAGAGVSAGAGAPVPPTTPKGNRLGGTPTARRLGVGTAGTGIGDWFSPSKRDKSGPLVAASPDAPGAAGAADADEIDWAAVDTDSLEADAEARTPHGTPHATPRAGEPAVKAGTPASRLQDRLVAVAGKRKRDDDKAEPTPKKQSNPFIDSTPRPTTPARAGPTAIPGSTHSTTSIHSTGSLMDDQHHPALVPVVAALDGLGEHLARQDRLVRAAEAMKKSMRQTIHNLQERVKELERELAEAKK